MHPLHAIFNPRSVAIVGASRTRGKIGNEILRNIVYGGYRGAIFPVNPNAESILGFKAYSRVTDVPYEIDLGVIAVPAEVVPQVMQDCVKKGVKGVVIISAGFSEIGRSDLENEIKKIAVQGGIRIIGPNTLGLISTECELNASFAPAMPLRGDIALVTQSGALGGALVDWTIKERIGLSKLISVGNKCDIDDADILEYLGEDRSTNVIVMYVESFKDGRKFMQSAARVSKQKPVIAVKAGKGEAGMRAAASHTGAIAGSIDIYRAAFKQCGVILSSDTEELFDMAMALSFQKPARGNRVAIITNGGGAGILAADACETYGLKVPKFSEATVAKLQSFLPKIAGTLNPVDIIGDAGYERYKATIEVVLESEEVDGVIVIFVQSALVEAREPARALADAAENAEKPLLGCWIGGYGVEEAVRILKERGIAKYPTPKRAVAAMSALVRQGEILHEKNFNRG